MKIYSEATKGNMRAAKLFLEATKPNEKPIPRTVQSQKNNFAQINGVVISQEQQGELTVEKRDQLFAILNLVK